MLFFAVKPHTTRNGIAVVEVWSDKPMASGGELLATITPGENEDELYVASKHMAGASVSGQLVTLRMERQLDSP